MMALRAKVPCTFFAATVKNATYETHLQVTGIVRLCNACTAAGCLPEEYYQEQRSAGFSAGGPCREQ
jgi:hypothetical protein